MSCFHPLSHCYSWLTKQLKDVVFCHGFWQIGQWRCHHVVQHWRPLVEGASRGPPWPTGGIPDLGVPHTSLPWLSPFQLWTSKPWRSSLIVAADVRLTTRSWWHRHVSKPHSPTRTSQQSRCWLLRPCRSCHVPARSRTYTLTARISVPPPRRSGPASGTSPWSAVRMAGADWHVYATADRLPR